MRKKIPAFLTLITFGLSSLNLPLLAASTNHFKTVDSYLEQGGILYGFVDIDGDIERLTRAGMDMFTQMRQVDPQLAMVPPLPFDQLIGQLGFNSLQAVGFSSTVREVGFHNRTFFLTDGAPSGLLGFYGQENAPFEVLSVAPASSDFVGEQNMDLDVIVAIAREIAAIVMGPEGDGMIDGYLGMPIPETSFTIGELVTALDGRSYIVGEIDNSQKMELPEMGEMPKIEFLIRLESAAGLVEKLAVFPAFLEMPNFEASAEGNVLRLSGFVPENPYFAPLILGDSSSGDLWLVSSEAYLVRCMDASGAKLASTEAYAQATDGLPKSGVSLAYVSADVGALVRDFIDRAVEQGGPEAAIGKPYMLWSFESFMAEHPMASVGTIEANGLYGASNWNVSHKRNLATMAYANPVTIGLMAAMAIPAFQKVRSTSQEKAITNNLRQLASAAQQYFLENGVTSVETSKLIGSDSYIRSFQPVAGETYPEVIKMNQDLIATLPDGKVVTLDF